MCYSGTFKVLGDSFDPQNTLQCYMSQLPILCWFTFHIIRGSLSRWAFLARSPQMGLDGNQLQNSHFMANWPSHGPTTIMWSRDPLVVCWPFLGLTLRLGASRHPMVVFSAYGSFFPHSNTFHPYGSGEALPQAEVQEGNLSQWHAPGV